MFIRFLIFSFMLLTSFVIASSAHAAKPLPTVQANELTQLYQTFNTARLAAIAARKQAERQQSDVAELKANLPKVDQEAVTANSKLKQLQDNERETPGSVKSEVMEAARKNHLQAQAAKKDAQANLDTAIGNYNRTVKEADSARLAEQHARAGYLARFDQMASDLVTQRVNTLKKPQDNIETTAYKPCDDLAVKECKKAAQKEAERKAIEKGSIIVVDSITEIQNLTLKRDEVRSEVHGAISNLKIVSAVLKDDPAAYTITINTTVTPIITEPLLRGIHQSVRMDMSAQVGDGGLFVQQSAPYQPQPSYLSVEATPKSTQSEPSADAHAAISKLETIKGEEAKYTPLMIAIPGKNYEMGKYEVTQKEWRDIMGNNPSNFSNCGDNCPVEAVNWNDIQEFLTKLKQKTGKQYRLPKEAEWEYACIGGAGKFFLKPAYCGSNDINAVAWYESNSNKTTHPVGQKQANGYGLYDMSGNVWEWQEDCYGDDCARRMFRGGSWFNSQFVSVMTINPNQNAALRSTHIGFRLARTLP